MRTITITRQMGSGGSYLGRLIAERLGLRYIDREVLMMAADDWGIEPEIITARAERVSSFWEKALRGFSFGAPYASYAPPPLPVFTDQNLFEKLTEIMKILAEENDCLIVGWGGSFVLPRHEGMTTIFCHAPLEFRVQRVIELFNAENEEAAVKMIKESDEMRKRYVAQMTGKEWACAENFDLAIDTSLIAFEKTAEMIGDFITLRELSV